MAEGVWVGNFVGMALGDTAGAFVAGAPGVLVGKGVGPTDGAVVGLPPPQAPSNAKASNNAKKATALETRVFLVASVYYWL